MDLFKKEVEELRPLVPPVPVQLGVIWRDDKRRMPVECREHLPSLLDPLSDEVRCVRSRLIAGHRRNVRLLFVLRDVTARDAVILETEMATLRVGVEMRL